MTHFNAFCSRQEIFPSLYTYPFRNPLYKFPIFIKEVFFVFNLWNFFWNLNYSNFLSNTVKQKIFTTGDRGPGAPCCKTLHQGPNIVSLNKVATTI